MVLLAIFSAGCVQETENNDVQEKVDPIADRLVEAIIEKNYTKFSEDFTPLMQKALPEEMFVENNKLVLETLGEPTSKEFLKAVEGDRYTTVTYVLTFEDESEAFFNIALLEEHNETKIAGVWIDSPILREKLDLERKERHP
nr:DUF3887 domain-containing protein [Methanohalophilus levihalophilus]